MNKIIFKNITENFIQWILVLRVEIARKWTVSIITYVNDKVIKSEQNEFKKMHYVKICIRNIEILADMSIEKNCCKIFNLFVAINL